LLVPLEIEFQRRGGGAPAQDGHEVDLIPHSAGIADEQDLLQRIEAPYRCRIGNALAVDRVIL
jgi:hypothetical protein